MSTPKPFALDLGQPADLEQLKARLQTLFDNANFMFEQLYRDLATANPLSTLGTGFVAKTAASAYAVRTLQAGSGIAITNPNGVNGDPSISVSGGGVTKLVKNSDQTITNSSALQNDNDFTFQGAANTYYLVHCYMALAATSTTPDWKFNWSLPAGASIVAWGPEWNQSVANWNNVATASSPVAAITGQISGGSFNGTQAFNFVALLSVAGTAGTCVLQWAQNTAGGVGVTSTVKAGSIMIVH